MRRFTLPLALSLLLLAVAGCGGSSGSAASSARSSAGASSRAASAGTLKVLRAALIAKADAICARLNNELAADKPADKSLHEIARVTPRHAADELRDVGELSRLTPPTTLASDWRRIIADRRTLAEELGKLGHDAETGDEAGIRALAVSKRRMHRGLAEVAGRAGLTDCAKVG